MSQRKVVEGRYAVFLEKATRKQWHRLGARRRSGVATPLFSLYSAQSTGIGEIPDLKLLADWCRKTGLSIIQLLPLNDVGFDFRPYDAASTFALDPMYLSLEDLEEVDRRDFSEQVKELRCRFPTTGQLNIDYGIKKAKLDLLWEVFCKRKKDPPGLKRFEEANAGWLEGYALYQVIKENNQQRAWEEWDPTLRFRDAGAIREIREKNRGRVLFFKWLQWQLFEQFRKVKEYVNAQGVWLMGDLPFLVSRDSADVWAYQDYFKLDLSAGAPPDMYFAKGQRWGMPPYNWSAIARDGYDYLIQKLRYAENFYDLFRIDHVVGVFRVWTVPISDDPANAGLHGSFDPPEESEWEAHGRRILSVMIENSNMLPCGEDLGTVPPCSYTVLADYGIPGMDVQRWTRDWGNTYDFLSPSKYRLNSIAVISTHDMSSLRGWWAHEAGTVDGLLFQMKCESRRIDFEAIKDRLFDRERSCYGRLRWKQGICREDLLRALGRPEEEVSDFVALYLGSVDEKERFCRYVGLELAETERISPAVARAALCKVHETASVFSIQLLQDWLSLAPLNTDPWTYRINIPGTKNGKNWTLRMPYPLEGLMDLSINDEMVRINQETERFL